MIDLIKLNTTGRVDFKIEPDLSDYYNDQIKNFENLSVEGFISDLDKTYQINIHITGKMILKSSINLSDVTKELDIFYDEYIDNLAQDYKKTSKSLDISPIIWENILLEIPLRAVNENDEYKISSGDGWEIIN